MFIYGRRGVLGHHAQAATPAVWPTAKSRRYKRQTQQHPAVWSAAGRHDSIIHMLRGRRHSGSACKNRCTYGRCRAGAAIPTPAEKRRRARLAARRLALAHVPMTLAPQCCLCLYSGWAAAADPVTVPLPGCDPAKTVNIRLRFGVTLQGLYLQFHRIDVDNRADNE